MGVKIKSALGSVTLDAENIASNTTVTVPAGGGTLVKADASGNVGIGTSSPTNTLHIKNDSPSILIQDNNSSGTSAIGYIDFEDSTGSRLGYFGYASSNNSDLDIRQTANAGIHFWTNDTERLQLTGDGRGLSQFTAKLWISFTLQNTAAINDSHNVSSLTDGGVGKYTVNFSNNTANSNYAVVSGFADGGGFNDQRTLTHEDSQERSTSGYAGYFIHSNGSLDDPREVSLAIFGD